MEPTFIGADATTPKSEIVILKAKDGTIIVHKSIATKSETLENLLKDTTKADTEAPMLPIPDFPAEDIKIALNFCRCLVTATELSDFTNKREAKVIQWQLDFIKPWAADFHRLLEILHAADFLHIQQFMDLIAYQAATHIEGKTKEELRAMLGIKKGEEGFTEKDLAEIAEEEKFMSNLTPPPATSATASTTASTSASATASTSASATPVVPATPVATQGHTDADLEDPDDDEDDDEGATAAAAEDKGKVPEAPAS